jgi:ferritin-like metal-binding protein YciE
MMNLTKLNLTPYEIQVVDSPLYESLIVGLQEIYWCENHLVRTLLKLDNASISRDVKSVLHAFLENTKHHIYRLDQIFELLDEEIDVQQCDELKSLCREAEDSISSTPEASVRDERIVCAGEKLSAHETRAYEKLLDLATSCGRVDIVKLLDETLKEEYQTFHSLQHVRDLKQQKISEAA